MFFQDIKYAIRSLIFDRGITAVVIVCLALGIGINATLFSLIDGVLIQSLPFVEADRLVILNETFQRGGIREAGVSYQDLRDFKAQTTKFSAIVASSFRSIALSDRTEAERFQGAAISWDLFPTLGVPPALGRHFSAEDDRPGAEPVVILSDDVWRRRYNGDPSIIGRSITVNGKPHTVVGVMPVEVRLSREPTRCGFRSRRWREKDPRDQSQPLHPRAPEARRRHGPGARGDDVDRRNARLAVSADQRRLERHRAAAARGFHPRRTSGSSCSR